MRRGVAFVPEDRASDGAFLSLSVTENLSAATLERYVHGGVLRRSAERSDARSDLQKLRLRAANPAVPLHALSGGNQQKVVITRWLRMDTKLLLLDEPTQGVDVQARAEIHDFVRQAAERGVAVIVVSSDFEELAALCDRILVLADGRFVAEGYPPEATADWIAEQTHVATVGGAA
jgi:ribose transport system ATP-binding protein